MEQELAKNVLKFIEKCAREVGKFEKETFEYNIYQECVEYGYDDIMKSPIEHILYCAIRMIQRLNFIDDYDMIEINHKVKMRGLSIQPRKRIGTYRCDFLIEYYNSKLHDNGGDILPEQSIIIECDSQLWHERTEQERRYEKERDRYFTKNNYKVFHYTGSEIVKNPLRITIEILSFVTGRDDLQLDANISD
jgi:very-short-patch-repair endonuclease